MAVRCLRSKLSKRIFTHVLEDAQIMPPRLVKGLPPLASEGPKIAPLARHSIVSTMGSSTMPIKNMTFQSFKSKVQESITFGFVPANAKNLFYNEATYNLCSSFEGKSGPILIHGRRNFSSCPEGTKNIPKMNSGNKGSSRSGIEKIPGVKGDSDSSRSRSEEIDILLKKQRKIENILRVFVVVYYFALYYSLWQILDYPPLFFFTLACNMCALCLLRAIYFP